MKKLFFSFLILSSFSLFAQDKPSYVIYNSEGQATTYKLLLEGALKTDIVLFGELHNNPIAHWLQLQLTKDVYNKVKSNLVLGAEMLEADNQIIINEYLAKYITYKTFKAEARLWNNFETDYKPLFDIAYDNKLKFVATNIPRRYASIVNSSGFEGLDKLSDEAKNWFVPLPVKYDANLPGYKKMLDMGAMGNMPGKTTNENFPKAQAIKDATMAYFILQNWSKGHIFIHYHGTFHSDNYDGIYWYLKQAQSEFNILTISTVEQEDISILNEENRRKADFIICVPADMTKTY